MTRLPTLGAMLAWAGVAFAQENVLILVADDVGVDFVGCYEEGPVPANTPNIDALASKGVLFRNAWAAPICSATRAQIMTGRYGYRTGLTALATNQFGLPLEEYTLPEAIDARSRRRVSLAAFGKWHLGNDALGGGLAPNLAGWTHFAGTEHNLNQPESYYSWTHWEDGVVTAANEYSTTRIVDDFIAWREAEPGPWMAYVAFHAAHEPFHEPPAHLHTVDLPDVDPRKDPVPFFRATIEALDTEIGRLLASLGPDLPNTHVVFLGDNGTPDDASVAPFLPEHAKMTPYEGGIGVPLIVSGPAVVGPGREVTALVTAVDVFESTLDLLGLLDVAPPVAEPALPRDGISFVPYLRKPGSKHVLRKIAYEEYVFPSGSGPADKDLRMARDARYKLIRDRLKGIDRFFDLETDPFETTDLLPLGLTAGQQARYEKLSDHIEERLSGL